MRDKSRTNSGVNRPSVLRVWPYLVLLCAVVLCLWRLPAARVLTEGEGFEEMLPNGEAFLHHIPGLASSYRMPMAAIVMAWYQGHSPEWMRTVFQAVLWTAPVFVAFQAGCLLQSPAAGALSALAVAAPLAMNATGLGEELIYRLLLGLAGVLFLWRAARPDLGRSVLLGLGIGASLLCRSPLFLLPVFLAVYDLKVRRPRGRVEASLALVAASFILLIPWVYLNWRLGGRFVLFENGRSDNNVISGALGIVETVAENSRGLSGVPEGERVMPWAVRQVVSHPLRYAAGLLGRLWLVFRLEPVLCLAAAAALWIHRRRESYRLAGLFCLYFIGMHCLLSIEGRYLEPIWVLMATLGISGLVALLPPPKTPAAHERLRWIIWPAFAAGAAGACLTLYFLVTYPTDSLLPVRSRLARAVALSPKDAWLIHLEDRDLLQTGRGPFAVAGAQTAMSLQPKNGAFLFAYVWAMTTAGKGSEEWMARITTGLDPLVGGYRNKVRDGYLLKALWLLDRGDRAGAAKAYEAALTQGDSPQAAPRLKFLLSAWPAAARMVLVRRVLRLDASPLMLAELLPLLGEEGAHDSGSKSLWPRIKSNARADGPEKTHREAMEHQGRSEYEQTIRLLDGLISDYPANAKLRGDRGVAYALMGRGPSAVEDLEAAIRIDPYYPSAYLSLGGVLTGLKEYRKASDLYETALRHDCFKIDPVTCRDISRERDRLKKLSR